MWLYLLIPAVGAAGYLLFGRKHSEDVASSIGEPPKVGSVVRVNAPSLVVDPEYIKAYSRPNLTGVQSVVVTTIHGEARMGGFDLGQAIKDVGNTVSKGVSAITPDFVKDEANKIADGMPDWVKKAANDTFGAAALNNMASAIAQGLSQGAGILSLTVLGGLAAVSAPFAVVLEVGTVILPGLLAGKSFDQSLQSGIMFNMAKGIMALAQGSAGDASSVTPQAMQDAVQQFKDQYQQATDYLKSIAPDDASLQQLGITPSELAEKLGFRVDIAASVLNFVKQTNAYDLSKYDPATGLPLQKTLLSGMSQIAPSLRADLAKYKAKGQSLTSTNGDLFAKSRPMVMKVINGIPIPFPASSAFTDGYLSGIGIIASNGPNPKDLLLIKSILSSDDAKRGFIQGALYYRRMHYVGGSKGSRVLGHTASPAPAPVAQPGWLSGTVQGIPVTFKASDILA